MSKTAPTMGSAMVVGAVDNAQRHDMHNSAAKIMHAYDKIIAGHRPAEMGPP